MTRLIVVAAVVLSVLLPAPNVAQADSDGFLYLKRFVPKSQQAEFKGFVEPRLFVYDSEGNLLRSAARDGAYPPGEKVAVSAGDYLVEVAQHPNVANRWRYTVKAGKVTLVRSGIVVLPTTPLREQPADTCQQWRAIMQAHVRDQDGYPQMIMTNEREDIDDFGMLQLHEGEYVMSFNGLQASLVVRADHSVSLPTARVDPMPQRGYVLSMSEDESVSTLSIPLCAKRATQVLEGRYWGGYYVELKTPPFRRRVWEPVDIGSGAKPRYKKAPAVKVPGRVLKGKAARPRKP